MNTIHLPLNINLRFVAFSHRAAIAEAGLVIKFYIVPLVCTWLAAFILAHSLIELTLQTLSAMSMAESYLHRASHVTNLTLIVSEHYKNSQGSQASIKILSGKI